MSLRDDYVATIERENAELRERIAVLEDALGVRMEAPLVLNLTSAEARLFGFLLKRDLVRKDAAMIALYGHRATGEVAEPRIIDVFVCKMRKKLAPFAIMIETQWGQGYFLGPRSKEIARALMPERIAA
jgi:two-component system cell cycle response regulator CtrA